MTHAAPPRDGPNEALHAILPWYVNGTLPQDERERVARLIQQSREMQDEVRWLESLREHMQSAVPEQAGDAGLDRLRTLIRAEQSGVLAALPERHAAAPRRWPTWAVPMALAATIVLSVLVTMVHLPSRDGTLEPLSGQAAPAGAVIIQVTFKAAAPEGDIRQLVSSVKGEIVSGPGALGVYSLRVERARGEQALAALAARKDLVESVSLVAK